MSIRRAVTASFVLLAAALAVTPASALERKCGTVAAIFMVDGRLANSEAFQQAYDGGDLHAVQVVCWNPSDSTFSKMAPGIPFYEVLTRPFVDGITSQLLRIERAQRAYFDRSGRYTADLGELGLDGLRKGGLEIALTVEAGGWSASASRGSMVHRCSVAGGAPGQNAPGGDAGGVPAQDAPGGDAAGAPTCVFDTKRKMALPIPAAP